MQALGVLLGVLVGAVVAGGAFLFLLRTKSQQLDEATAGLKAAEEKLRDEQIAKAKLEERSLRVDALEAEVREQEAALDSARNDLETLRLTLKGVEKERDSDRRSFEERKAELDKVIREADARLQDAFKALASEALGHSNKQFLNLAKETLEKYQEQAKGDLDKKQTAIETLVKPLSESLQKYEENLQRLEKDHASRDAKTEEQIQNLLKGVQAQQSTMSDLKGLFRGPTSRGRVGEIFLKRMLEAAGLEEGLHYDMQVSETTETGRQRPDCVVKLPSSKALIIDAKTPLNAYEDSLALDDDSARALKLKEHAVNVRREVDSLAKRSYTDLNIEADLVVMYLPIEASLNAALQIDPEIMSYGWDRKVVVTTPTLLYALLQIVALDWRQESIRKNAEEITKLGKDMVDRIRIVANHLRKVGTGLRTANDSYNAAITSMERNLLTTAKGFQKLGTGRDVKIDPLPEVTAHVEEFKKSEILELPSAERMAELNLFDQAAIFDEGSESDLTDGLGDPV